MVGRELIHRVILAALLEGGLDTEDLAQIGDLLGLGNATHGRHAACG